MFTVREKQWFPAMMLNEIFGEAMQDCNCKMKTVKALVNIAETETEYVIEVAAPGTAKENFKVQLDVDGNLVLSIDSQKHCEEGCENTQYLRREFAGYHFNEVYRLPKDVDKQAIGAKVENGVLTVMLPKLSIEAMQKEVKLIDIQ